MSPATATSDQPVLEPTNHVVLSGIDWEMYTHLRQALDGSGRHVVMVYNDGELLIEMPNKVHEVVKAFIRGLLEAYLIDHKIDFSPLGATTWQRELKRKGLEADESYYIQHVDIADAREEVDLDLDPPPDLAIEVEITVPLLKKLPVYAGIGIPEVWHIKGYDEVRLLTLDAVDGQYRDLAMSVAVPGMTADRLRSLLGTRRELPYLKALEKCRRAWS